MYEKAFHYEFGNETIPRKMAANRQFSYNKTAISQRNVNEFSVRTRQF